MNVISLRSFYETVPAEKREKVTDKIRQLVSCLTEFDHDWSRLPAGLRVQKLTCATRRIFKCRVDDYERILYTYGNELAGVRPEHKESLVLLSYTNHHDQARDAEFIDWTEEYEALAEEERPVVDVLKKGEEFRQFVPMVVDEAQLDELFGVEAPLYYLSDEQARVIEEQNRGQFLFGSAGSGKTTVALYKLLQQLKSEKGRMMYLTFSRPLKQEAETMFTKLADVYGLTDERQRVDFKTIEEWLEQHDDQQRSTVHYPMFANWYAKQKKKKLDPMAIWKEGRGVLLGMIDANWQETTALPLDDFSATLLRNRHVKQEGAFAYLTAPLAQVSRSLIPSFNRAIAKRKPLTLEQYLALSETYSPFTEEDRRTIYATFDSFKRFVEKQRTIQFETDFVKQQVAMIEAQYDYIVVDEVQDFTELQLYYVAQLLHDQRRVLICGDFHQTIHPTFFQPGRIEGTFKFFAGLQSFTTHCLSENYRSAEKIVNVAAEVVKMRELFVPSPKKWDYVERPMRRGGGQPYVFTGDVHQLWLTVYDKSYVMVLVPDETVKEEVLQKCPMLAPRLFTVAEAKGIERQQIIGYRLLSHYKQMWCEMQRNPNEMREIYRFYFNVLYVAMTRARDAVCLIEPDAKELDLWGPLFLAMQWTSDIQFDEQSTTDDWWAEAAQLEAHDLFKQASLLYAQVAKQDETRASVALVAQQRCDILAEYAETNNREKAGKRLFEIGEYELAVPHLAQSRHYPEYIQALYLTGREEEVDVEQLAKKRKLSLFRLVTTTDDEGVIERYMNRQFAPLRAQQQKLTMMMKKGIV